jgi:hypothetical protein
MVAVSCLSINGLYLCYAKHFFGRSRKLKIFLLFYTLRAVKWQTVWLVCKNQDTLAVQNVSFRVEEAKNRFFTRSIMFILDRASAFARRRTNGLIVKLAIFISACRSGAGNLFRGSFFGEVFMKVSLKVGTCL